MNHSFESDRLNEFVGPVQQKQSETGSEPVLELPAHYYGGIFLLTTMYISVCFLHKSIGFRRLGI